MKLSKVRLSYPALFEPKSFAGQEGAPKFGAAFLIPKTDTKQIEAIRAEMMSVATAKWGPKANAVYTQLVAADRVCLRDGDSKPDSDGYENCMFVGTSAVAQPTVLDADKTPLGPHVGRPYGGCYVNAIIQIWAQDNKFGKRINASLRGVQFVADGDSFSASAPAKPDDFDDLSTDNSDIL